MRIIEIPINKIRPDPNQPRKYFDKEVISNMAQSIKTEGLVNPIEVDKDFVIVTGGVRWRAAKEAGLKTVLCRVIKIADKDRFRRQVIENIHHNTMVPLDTARALKKMLAHGAGDLLGHDKKGMAKLGREIGMPESTVKEYFTLLEASETVQQAVNKGLLPLSGLSAIRGAPLIYQEQIEKKALKGEFRSRDIIRQLSKSLQSYPKKSKELLAINFTDLDIRGAFAAIHKIIPEYSETPGAAALEKSFEPSIEIVDAALKLRNLLQKYSFSEIGSFNLPRVIMALNGVTRQLGRWTSVELKLLDNEPKELDR